MVGYVTCLHLSPSPQFNARARRRAALDVKTQQLFECDHALHTLRGVVGGHVLGDTHCITLLS